MRQISCSNDFENLLTVPASHVTLNVVSVTTTAARSMQVKRYGNYTRPCDTSIQHGTLVAKAVESFHGDETSPVAVKCHCSQLLLQARHCDSPNAPKPRQQLAEYCKCPGKLTTVCDTSIAFDDAYKTSSLCRDAYHTSCSRGIVRKDNSQCLPHKNQSICPTHMMSLHVISFQTLSGSPLCNAQPFLFPLEKYGVTGLESAY